MQHTVHIVCCNNVHKYIAQYLAESLTAPFAEHTLHPVSPSLIPTQSGLALVGTR